MRRSHLRVASLCALALVHAAACNTTSSGDVDAPTSGSADAPVNPGVTSCGEAFATTAPDGLTLTGKLNDGSVSASPVADATVTAFGAGVARGSAQTEIGGVYQVSVTTGGKPVDYVTFEKAGSLSARYYPRTPIAFSTTVINLPLYSTADAASFAAMFGVTGTGAVAVVNVVDCHDTPADGATVTASSGTVKYLHSDGTTTGSATDASGVAVVLNMAAGSGTIDANDGTGAYRTLAVDADPSYFIDSVISPK